MKEKIPHQSMPLHEYYAPPYFMPPYYGAPIHNMPMGQHMHITHPYYAAVPNQAVPYDMRNQPMCHMYPMCPVYSPTARQSDSYLKDNSSNRNNFIQSDSPAMFYSEVPREYSDDD